MPDPTAVDYCRFAGSRLEEARDKFLDAVALGYDDTIGDVAKVASLIWDAAIDMLSALALLDGEEATGVSSDLRRYARNYFPDIVAQRWGRLARLHNFQHKPNLTEREFRQELYYTGVLLRLFNEQIPQGMQLSEDSFAWLATNQPNS